MTGRIGVGQKLTGNLFKTEQNVLIQGQYARMISQCQDISVCKVGLQQADIQVMHAYCNNVLLAKTTR